MQTQAEPTERKPLSAKAKKALTEQTRKENIREAEKRRGAVKREREKPPDDPKISKQEKLTVQEIRKRLRKLAVVETKPKKDLPYFILRPQKQIPYEQDFEVVDALHEQYLSSKKNTLTEKRGYQRETLKFGHVKDCPKVVYYDFFKPHTARPYTVKGLRFFEDGTVFHEIIQDRLGKIGALKHSEGYLNIPEVHANGFYDGLIPVEQDGKWLVCDILEIKRKFPNVCQSPMQPDYDQGQLYLIGARDSESLKMQRIKIRNLRLFYSDRSIQTDELHFGFMCKPDPERQLDIMKYMRFLWNDVVCKKMLVPQPFEKDSDKCSKYCRYFAECWGEYPDRLIPQGLDEIKLPSQEIIESAAARALQVLGEIGTLQDEYKKTLKPILEAYFLYTKETFLKVKEYGQEEIGLAPTQPRNLEWINLEELIEKIGVETFLKISKPDRAAVSDLVKTHFLDMGIFEQHKQHKLGSVTIKTAKRRIKKETLND